jgi:hypothetical protein
MQMADLEMASLKANARAARLYQSRSHIGKMVTSPSSCFGGDRKE